MTAVPYGRRGTSPSSRVTRLHVANRTTPTRLGEISVEQDIYCPGPTERRTYPPPVRVHLELDPALEPWRALLWIGLRDDTGGIDTRPTQGPLEWELLPGCGVLPSAPAGARTFTARALLPDGVTLEPAKRAFEVRCPICPERPRPDPDAWATARRDVIEDSGCNFAGGRDALDSTAALVALAFVGARLRRPQRRT